ncbi:hypothetical protein [Nonomuraea sp. NPDC050202]|uniref:hypothetical protein n=1 Tax=Nonomuraea sp. NPDC050202 TaxID=3155035 RepID=UPI0033E0EB51
MLELNVFTREQARLWSQEGEPVPEDGTRDLRGKIVKIAGSSPDPDWENLRTAVVVVHQTLLDFAEFVDQKPQGSTEMADFIRARRRFQEDVLKAVRQLINALSKVLECSS